MADLRYRYTCPTCFAAVPENKADDHKAWHAEFDDDFESNMTIFRLLRNRIERLEGQTD